MPIGYHSHLELYRLACISSFYALLWLICRLGYRIDVRKRFHPPCEPGADTDSRLISRIFLNLRSAVHQDPLELSSQVVGRFADDGARRVSMAHGEQNKDER